MCLLLDSVEAPAAGNDEEPRDFCGCAAQSLLLWAAVEPVMMMVSMWSATARRVGIAGALPVTVCPAWTKVFAESARHMFFTSFLQGISITIYRYRFTSTLRYIVFIPDDGLCCPVLAT